MCFASRNPNLSSIKLMTRVWIHYYKPKNLTLMASIDLIVGMSGSTTPSCGEDDVFFSSIITKVANLRLKKINATCV